MFKIGKVKFDNKKTVIIAEVGVNHNGNLNLAYKLIRSAKKAGADIVKFQTYKANKLTTKKAPRFWSWDGEVKKEGTQHDSYSRLDSFSKIEYQKIIKECKKIGIEFMSTPFDTASAKMLRNIGMKGYKIASCDITNFQLLEYVAKTKMPILLSTGASNVEEIKKAVKIIKKNGNKKILIMHCTLCYPTAVSDVNLNAINDLRNKFKNELIGFSDHSLGTLIPTAAFSIGISALEKHFTINKKLKLSADHWLSVDEKELKEIVNNSRLINKAKSKGKLKKVLKCEKKARKYARRSIVSDRFIKKGSIIRIEDLALKRPGTGMQPSKIKSLIGKKTKRSIYADTLIKTSMIN
jgi:N,N'-diacetyllegionaminate synthase